MVDAITANQAVSRTGTSRASLVSNFETFLQLLTAQLKNQDPLSPVDSNQFTAQLTQMAGVEQQLLTNDLLTSLLSAQQGGGLDQLVLRTRRCGLRSHAPGAGLERQGRLDRPRPGPHERNP